MEQDSSDKAIKQRLSEIVAKEKGYETAMSPFEQEKFLKGFSIGALVYGPVYFALMGDSLLSWISVIGSLFFPPIALVLPFFSRRRAWQKRKWLDFAEFKFVQKKWDMAGIYGFIILILVFYLSIQFVILPLVNSMIPASTTTDSLQQEVNDLQDLMK